ncbi:MAG: SDR family oxidoreductase, partial [Rhodospirillales bacterium]|nr:SDR family oxidoreductase [Rhodospirillales bacterium]
TGGSMPYRVSKAALNSVAKNLSVELAPRGITTICTHPGWVRTDMGGPSAAIDAGESIAGLRKVIDGLTPADNGKFFNYDGTEFPW